MAVARLEDDVLRPGARHADGRGIVVGEWSAEGQGEIAVDGRPGSVHDDLVEMPVGSPIHDMPGVVGRMVVGGDVARGRRRPALGRKVTALDRSVTNPGELPDLSSNGGVIDL